jgi:hypothetical protein
MVWGAFCFYGVLPLAFPSSRMNSQEYQQVLQEHLIPFHRNSRRILYTFQQDNASVHVSTSTMEWFRNKNIPLMQWPACSPDCNPIENLWGILVRRVYANNRQFHSVPQLKAAILTAWNEIGQNTLQSLVNSMPERIFEVIRNEGGAIDY